MFFGFSCSDSHARFGRTLLRWSASALLVVGCAAPGEPVGRSGEAIINGALAQHTDWGGVVALESEGQIVCTGSVIARRAVVTAAHCIEDGTIDAIRYGANELVDQQSGETHASAPRIAVTAQMGMSSDVFDVAVLTLGADFPGTIYPLARGCGAATQGGEVTLVGYGTASRPGEEITFGILNQRTLSVNMVSCNDTSIGCPAGTNGEAELVTSPAGMCGGDSGGPIFVVNEHGRFVAGVVSGPTTDEASEDCGDWQRGRYPRPDTAVAYIEGLLGAPLMQPTCNGTATDAGPPGADAGPIAPGTDAGPLAPGTDAGPPAPMSGGCSVGASNEGSGLGLFALLTGLALVTRRRFARV